MGRRDGSATKIPINQYRKQIGRHDYKKAQPILRSTKEKANFRRSGTSKMVRAG
uniref:Triple QxxK/R motif-containing protein n=1 Tax=Eptatretus burgeri TaxID=7764 RepID=A0A8C4PYC5_EPTBU